jgi:putative transposase
MARQARIVIAETPHHVTQRGNRGEKIFFEKSDFETYVDLLREQCEDKGVAIQAYCLLPNQIHLIAVPRSEGALASAIGETHRRYTVHINGKNDWRGHLFQDRFFSYAMDERFMLRAARFIENLPVVSGIAPRADNYLWSSAKCHVRLGENPLVKEKVVLKSMPDWAAYLERPMDPTEMDAIRLHLQTGRPRGNDGFIDAVEQTIGRTVRPQKRGRKPKAAIAA